VFPVQQLYMSPLPIQKDEDITAGGYSGQLRTNQATQAIKAFPHIAVTLVQIIPVRRVQAEH